MAQQTLQQAVTGEKEQLQMLDAQYKRTDDMCYDVYNHISPN